MKRHLVFIVNPHSGVQRRKHLRPQLERYLDHQVYSYEILETRYAGHGTALAKQAAKPSVYAVVVVGGDGSVNDVAQALINTSTAMGIIPMGSGNGLARALPIGRGYRKAILQLNKAQLHTIDVGKANDSIFLSNGGVGFDAFVMDGFHTQKSRGIWAYIQRIFNAMLSYKSLLITINLDEGSSINQKVFLLSVANGNQFGYNFHITKKAQLNDGLLDVIIIKKIPFWYYPILMYRSIIGNLHNSRFVQHHQVTSLSISSDELRQFQVDGEHRYCKDHLQIKILPSALQVLH